MNVMQATSYPVTRGTVRVSYGKLLFYSQDKLSFDHEGMVSYCLIISVIQVTILSKGKLRFNFVHSVFG